MHGVTARNGRAMRKPDTFESRAFAERRRRSFDFLPGVAGGAGGEKKERRESRRRADHCPQPGSPAMRTASRAAAKRAPLFASHSRCSEAGSLSATLPKRKSVV